MKGLYALGAGLALMTAPAAAAAIPARKGADIFDVSFAHRRSGRGKFKPRRHGQKLKSCRVKVGKRVRRKHRRAA